MEPLVALYGQQILWHTDVELVEFLHVCLCVQNAFKRAIMMDMTSTCLGMTASNKCFNYELKKYLYFFHIIKDHRLEELVTVETQV